MRRITILVIVLTLFCSGIAAAEDYLIGQGDGLEVSVWGVPDMSRSVTVRPDGKITLPAVGDIKAEKETPAKLSKIIAEKMKAYIKQPIVTVSVEKIVNNRVYVTGSQVSRVFDLVKETTLLKLLSEMGDLSSADLHRAYLLRGKQKINADFYALYYQGDISQDILLQAEDVIFLPSNRLNLVYVLGAVKSPLTLQFYDGMRVMDAILAAGGFTEFAKEDSVYVIDAEKNKKRLDLEQVTRGKDMEANIILKPGDYVIVDESLF